MRYVSLPGGGDSDPARRSWRDRSSLLLEGYYEDHEATLEDFGLTRALTEDGLTALLGMLPVSFTDPLRSRSALLDAQKLARTPEVERLIARARRIRDALWADMDDAVRFLFTGRVFCLPWIVVESDTATWPLTRYTIKIAAGDATAEDVRSAFHVAKVALSGSEDRGRALPEHVYALVAVESEGRSEGLTWGGRWQSWRAYAREWGWPEYETMESYRNYVKKLARENAWIASLVRGTSEVQESAVADLTSRLDWGEVMVQLEQEEAAENERRAALRAKGGESE